MATKLYLRITTDNVGTHARTEKSTALPVGTFKDGGVGLRDLSVTQASTAGDLLSISSLAQTGDQDIFMGKYISAPLVLSSIGADTWTVALYLDESNGAANVFTALSIYVLKSDDTVRTPYIADSHSTFGIEWAGNGQLLTVSGAGVNGIVNTDKLCIEVWGHATQSMGTSYQWRLGVEGNVDVTDGGSGMGSYIRTNLDLFTPTAQHIFWNGSAGSPQSITETDTAQTLSKTIHKTITPKTELDTEQELISGVTARNFDAIDDNIVTDIGNANAITGDLTLAVVFDPLSFDNPRDIVSLRDGANVRVLAISYDTLARARVYVASTSSKTLSFYMDASAGWILMAVTKTAGVTYPTFYIWQTHNWNTIAGDLTLDNPAAAANVRFAYLGDSSLVIAGVWDSVLSETQIHTLWKDTQNWVDLSPKALWNFDQASVNDPVLDITGGGADETSRTGTTVINTGPWLWNYEITAAQQKSLTYAPETDIAQALSITHIHYRTVTFKAETDQAQVLVKSKTKSVISKAETDTAQTLVKRKTKILGPKTETEVAQVLGIYHPQHKTLTFKDETDQAQSLVKVKIKSVVSKSETDTAQAIIHTKHKSIIEKAETDAAQTLAHRKTKAIGSATETDLAQILSIPQTIQISSVLITDTAQSLSITKIIYKSISSKQETDSSQALSFTKTIYKTIGSKSETDLAQGISHTRYRALVAKSEIDEAQILTFTKTIYKTLTASIETDIGQSLSITGAPAFIDLVAITETDTPQTISFTHIHYRTIPSITETDTSEILNVTKDIYKTLDASIETNSAQGLDKDKIKILLSTPESDSAQSVVLSKQKDISSTFENDLAQSLFGTKVIYNTATNELNIAQSLDKDKYSEITYGPETDTSQALIYAIHQVLRPLIDSVDGAWTNSDDGTELFSYIDEPVYSDIDYIKSELSPANSGTRIKLAPGESPQVGTRTLRLRIAKDTPAGEQVDLLVKLYEGGGDNLGGGTLIHSFQETDISTSFITVEEEITEAINDYANLYIELEANAI